MVKGLDNPFFEAIHQGCEKWNSENPDSEYECFYTGPASTSDEAGEAQIVQDMLGKSDHRRHGDLAVQRAADRPDHQVANPSIPIMTIDADLAKEDAGLRKTYLGTDNYLMGKRSANTSRRTSRTAARSAPIEGNAAADNILRRAQGMRDALSGQEGLGALDRRRRLDRSFGLPGLHQ